MAQLKLGAEILINSFIHLGFDLKIKFIKIIIRHFFDCFKYQQLVKKIKKSSNDNRV